MSRNALFEYWLLVFIQCLISIIQTEGTGQSRTPSNTIGLIVFSYLSCPFVNCSLLSTIFSPSQIVLYAALPLYPGYIIIVLLSKRSGVNLLASLTNSPTTFHSKLLNSHTFDAPLVLREKNNTPSSTLTHGAYLWASGWGTAGFHSQENNSEYCSSSFVPPTAMSRPS